MKKLFLTIIMLFQFTLAMAAININTANEAQLTSLSGIGPSKAKTIVEYREANGAFKSIEDIQKVKGIGPATFERIKEDIVIENSTKPKPAAAKK